MFFTYKMIIIKVTHKTGGNGGNFFENRRFHEKTGGKFTKIGDCRF